MPQVSHPGGSHGTIWLLVATLVLCMAGRIFASRRGREWGLVRTLSGFLDAIKRFFVVGVWGYGLLIITFAWFVVWGIYLDLAAKLNSLVPPELRERAERSEQ